VKVSGGGGVFVRIQFKTGGQENAGPGGRTNPKRCEISTGGSGRTRNQNSSTVWWTEGHSIVKEKKEFYGRNKFGRESFSSLGVKDLDIFERRKTGKSLQSLEGFSKTGGGRGTSTQFLW